MPWVRFSHTTGRTIRPEITAGTWLRPVHRSTSRMKEATGVARMMRITGANSRSSQVLAQVRAASSPPRATPAAMPAAMRSREVRAVLQNAGSWASWIRAKNTVVG